MIFAILFLLLWYTGVNITGYALSGSQPAVSTTMAAGITAGDTVIPVNSVAGFPGSGWLFIRGEAINYGAATETCPAPFAGLEACFTGASRGRQQTSAISHPPGAIVYNETGGVLDNLLGFEARTSIDELGEFSSPWSTGGSLIRFLVQVARADWPIYNGPFAIVKVITSLFTIAVVLGIGVSLIGLLTGSVRRLIP